MRGFGHLRESWTMDVMRHAPGFAACLLALASGACVHAPDRPDRTDPQSHNANRFPMNVQHTPINAEDIGKRVLRLIESIRNREDIAPANIEQITGMKVEFNPDNRNEYGFGGNLTAAWAYNLVSLTEATGASPSRLMFSFDDQTRSHADMAPICDLDFDDYAKALTAAGYRSNVVRGEHERVSHWDFSRDAVSVQVFVRGENDAKADHACVSKLIINA